MAPLVTATPAISNVKPQSTPVIGPSRTAQILAIVPATGQIIQSLRADVEMSTKRCVNAMYFVLFWKAPEPAPSATYTVSTAAAAIPYGSCRATPLRSLWFTVIEGSLVIK